jgi:hypothetical protein
VVINPSVADQWLLGADLEEASGIAVIFLTVLARLCDRFTP